MTFGERVRELRKERGWSQRELAKRADVDGQTIFRIEHGIGQGGWSSRKKLAKAFGITIAELTETEHPETEDLTHAETVAPLVVETLSEKELLEGIARFLKELERRRDPGDSTGPAASPAQPPTRPRKHR